MALLKCVDCGREVSDAAPVCPGCGHPASPRPAASSAASGAAGPVGILLVLGAGALFVWCELRPSTRDNAPAPPTIAASPPVVTPPAAPVDAGEAAEVLPPDEAAKDVAIVLKGTYPLSCKAAGATSDWATCHDETKGFDNVLRCAKAAQTKARSVVARVPSDTPRSTCGKAIATASRGVVMTAAKMLDDVVAWLEKHRAQLMGPMANAALSDACDAVNCDDMPNEFTAPYEGASYARVMGVNCTKTLFQCGTAADNVCWINKVADRLGLACDPTENKTDSPLSVRSTGMRIR